MAMGPGLALGLQISLEASDSPRWVSLGKGLGAVCLMPTDTRLRLTSLVLIWRRQEGEQLGVFLRARGKQGSMCFVRCRWEGWRGFLACRSAGRMVPQQSLPTP